MLRVILFISVSVVSSRSLAMSGAALLGSDISMSDESDDVSLGGGGMFAP